MKDLASVQVHLLDIEIADVFSLLMLYKNCYGTNPIIPSDFSARGANNLGWFPVAHGADSQGFEKPEAGRE